MVLPAMISALRHPLKRALEGELHHFNILAFAVITATVAFSLLALRNPLRRLR
jgi:hypothetical protein